MANVDKLDSAVTPQRVNDRIQRVANDSAANNYNSSYNQGLYVFSPDATQLNQAFNQIASEVLRVSK